MTLFFFRNCLVQPWRWRQYIPPKRWQLLGVPAQKTNKNIFVAVNTLYVVWEDTVFWYRLYKSVNHFSMDLYGCTHGPIKMEIEKQANRQHAIEPPPFSYIHLQSPVSPGLLQYSFIIRVNVSQLYGQFHNCPCPAVRLEYRDRNTSGDFLFAFDFKMW
jgi:hypothetical protein